MTSRDGPGDDKLCEVGGPFPVGTKFFSRSRLFIKEKTSDGAEARGAT